MKHAPATMVSGSPCSRRWKFYLLALISAWGLIYYFRLFDQKLLLGDEGYLLMNGWRISQGEIPHKDFFMALPALTPTLIGIMLSTFGITILTSRILAFAMAVTIVLALDGLLRRVKIDFSLRIMSLCLLIPFGVSYWPIPSHHWLCDIFCLTASYCFLRAFENHHAVAAKRFSFLTGVLLALAIWTLQDQGMYLFLLLSSFAVYMAVKGKKNGNSQNRLVARTLMMVSGAILASLPFLVWLLPIAGVGRLFQDLVLFSLTSYHGLEGHKAALFSGWNQLMPLISGTEIFKEPLYIISLIIIGIFLFIIPVLCLVSLFYGRMTKHVTGLKLFLILALFLSFFLTALHRWSFTNMVWALPGCIPALSPFFEGRLKKVARSLAVLLCLTSIVFSISFYRLANPEKMTAFCGKSGCVRTFASPQAAQAQSVVSYLEEHSREGDTLFSCGFNGFFNFITRMKNPTPFNEFLDFNSESQFEELADSFRTKKIDWVIVPAESTRTNHRVEKLIAEDYRMDYRNRYYKVFRKKDPFAR